MYSGPLNHGLGGEGEPCIQVLGTTGWVGEDELEIQVLGTTGGGGVGEPGIQVLRTMGRWGNEVLLNTSTSSDEPAGQVLKTTGFSSVGGEPASQVLKTTGLSRTLLVVVSLL